ncbi:PREDICTED: probable ribonuclease ZC3H12B, partial [Nicrophorus vespilloides]|uniref:Probable ribonuclease ZC3H12B n=1 Tax=Nicrophorus vespilloides TaxID=110193 RepID=A0ABM1MR68_NICVS
SNNLNNLKLFTFSHSQGRNFSVRGLKICIDFFVKRGHKVYAFVPSYRLKRNQSDNQALLMKLVDEQLVFCTSSREIFGKKICSYDDSNTNANHNFLRCLLKLKVFFSFRILVQAAAAMRAIIVTQDNYRDLLAEDPRLGPTIERGLLMPTWVGDMIIFPEDPLGRFGPKLERFLRYP